MYLTSYKLEPEPGDESGIELEFGIRFSAMKYRDCGQDCYEMEVHDVVLQRVVTWLGGHGCELKEWDISFGDAACDLLETHRQHDCFEREFQDHLRQVVEDQDEAALIDAAERGVA